MVVLMFIYFPYEKYIEYVPFIGLLFAYHR